MTMKTEPFLSGKYGWDLGEGDWKDGADENFLKFSYMLNGNVDGFVSVLPSSPLNGTAYFLTTDNTLNARVDGTWFSFPTPKGFVVTEKLTGDKYEYNGSAFVATFNADDKVKLNSIATGATVNATDALLRDRSTHTGVQSISTVTGLQNALDTKASVNSPTFTGTPTAPTVTGTDSSTKIATTAWVKSLGYATSSLVSSVAGRVGDVLLTKTDVGLANVDNIADTDKPVSTAQQTALNLKSNIASPTFTGTVTLPSTTSIGTVTSTELSYLDGVSSSIQGQIDAISGVSGGYAPINNPSFTGTVSGVTKAMVGLGNVDNTSDLAKPVSTATQTAINAKQNSLTGTGFVKSTGGTISYDTNSYASSVSPTFTGTVVLPSTTSIGSVTYTHLGYLLNTTSDIQTQLNNKATLSAPTFQSAVTVNAVAGQSSIYFSQASVNNGRVYAGGGGGTDIIIDSGRFVTMNPMINFKINFNNVVGYDFTPTTFTLPASGRISGDFSNTVNSSRVLVQTSTANSVTRFDVIPNGTSTTATVGAFNNSDPTNSAWARLTATASDVRVESTISGTGTYLPLAFYAGGSAKAILNANGNLLINTGTDAGYRLDVNGTTRVAGDLTTNGNMVISKSAPMYIATSTTALVATMFNYLSFRDSSATEQGWMGYGAANGEMGFNNSSRNIRFLSPIKSNSTIESSGQIKVNYTGNGTLLYTAGGVLVQSDAANIPLIGFVKTGAAGAGTLFFDNDGFFQFRGTSGSGGGLKTGQIDIGTTIKSGGQISARFNAGTTPAYNTGQMVLNNAASGNPVVLGLWSEGVSAASLVHLSGGNGLEVHGLTFGTYANLKALNLTATAGITGAGITATTSVSSPIYYSNLSTGTHNLDKGLIITDGSTYKYGVGVSANTGGMEYHANQVTAGAHRWYTGIFGSPSLAMTLSNTGDLSLNSGSFSGNGSALTSLNASNVSTGTLALARLPFTLGIASSAGTVVQRDGAGDIFLNNVTASSFIGSGTSLTGVITKATPSQTTQVINHTVANGLTINLALGSDIQINVSANITGLAFSNVPSTSEAWSVTIEFVVSGTRTITWPTGTRAAGGVLPSLTTNGTDVFVIRKRATDNYMVFTSGKAIA